MIVVEGLRREWPVSRGPPVVAVDDVSFHVVKGEIFGLLGPNGAGKTTIMQVLATLTPPTAGRARVAGHDVVRQGDAVRRHLGYLSTTSGLPSRLTVRECVVLFARLHGLPATVPGDTLARFRLDSFAERYVEALSTGMRQRLRIACATVHRPPVVILDEPTSGLDVISADELLDEVLALRASGTTAIYSTHLMEEAERICDRVAILHEGRIVALGAIPELKARTGATSLAEVFRRTIRLPP